MGIEAVVIPVADVDRSTRFYAGLGWRVDADVTFAPGLRAVQVTPPGSAAAIQFGEGVTTAPPGSARGLYLVVSDIEAAREALVARGAAVSEVFHAGTPGAQFREDGAGREGGPAPGRASYRSFATFADPDGNRWLLQEVTARLPGRTEGGGVAFASAVGLAAAMRRAEAAHAEHERRTGAPDRDWPGWYAAHMVAEQHGGPQP